MTPSPLLAGRLVARLDAAARLILRDPELARDAVQEGFIGAWRDLPSLRDPDRFEAWLHRLVFRACIDIIRRRGRRVIEVELSPFDGPAVERHGLLVADRELLDAACRAATRVARGRRPALLPRDAVARRGRRRSDIPVGTAKSRLHRGLGEMRATINGDLEPGRAPAAGGQPA